MTLGFSPKGLQVESPTIVGYAKLGYAWKNNTYKLLLHTDMINTMHILQYNLIDNTTWCGINT